MAQVNSWDAWDTLLARRSIKDVYDETDNLFPIAENVAKVRPGDIIVSDYYDEALLRQALREVCGLDNRLYFSEDGKRNGTMWATVKANHEVALHRGDNEESDVVAPRRAGIRSELTRLTVYTAIETEVGLRGFYELARLMREARLTTYDGTYRQNQLLQIEVNFPILLMASLLLHRRVMEYQQCPVTDVLMSSRDCCLWEHLQQKVRDEAGAGYRVHYFYSGRPARFRASPCYLNYVNQLMGERPVVVDLCGWGRSLPYLLDRTKHPDAPIWLLSKYPDHHRGPSRAVALAEGQAIRAASSLIERSNLARHAMAVDVDKRGHPVYFNPMSIYWKGVPEIAVMHRAFGVALKLLSRYAVIQEALTKSDATLVSILEFLFLQLKTYNLALRFQDDMMAKEEPAIEELLLSLGQ